MDRVLGPLREVRLARRHAVQEEHQVRVQRREKLPQLVVQVAGDAGALLLPGRLEVGREVAEALTRLLHLRLGALEVRDVLVGDDDIALLEALADPGGRDHAVHVGPVLAAARELHLEGPVLLQGPVENPRDLLVVRVGTVEEADALADDILGIPAEHGLDSVVGEDDPAVLQADDGVRDRLQDGGLERLEGLEAVARLDRLCDVHGIAQDGARPPVGDEGHRLHDPPDMPVLRDNAELVGRGAPAAQHLAGLLAHLDAVLGVHEAHGAHARQLRGIVARKGRGVMIDVLELAVLDDVDAGLRTRGEELVGLLRTPPVRDVLVDDDDALLLQGVADARGADQGLEGAAVAAPAGELETEGALALQVRVEHLGDLLEPLLRGVEQPGGAADELGGLPPENALDAVVGEDDPPVSKPDDGVGDRIQDGGLESLQLRQLGPRCDLPGHVHGVAQHGPLPPVVYGRDRLGDPTQIPVLADRHELVGVRALALEHGDGILADPLSMIGMDEGHGGHPDELVAVVPPVTGRVRVDEPELAVLQDVDARSRGALQAAIEPLLEKAVRLGALHLVDLLAQIGQLRDQLLFRIGPWHSSLSPVSGRRPGALRSVLVRRRCNTNHPTCQFFPTRGGPGSGGETAPAATPPEPRTRRQKRLPSGLSGSHQTLSDAPLRRRLRADTDDCPTPISDGR